MQSNLTSSVLRAAALALSLALASSSCRSTAAAPDAASSTNPIASVPDEPLGKLLADLDSAIGRWNSLTLTATTAAEQREARMLESVIADQAAKRRDELIDALESGPPINRIRAAGALGFSKAIEAQSPLLAALHDPHPDVVHNALTSLAILGRGDTPLDDVCRILEEHPDAQTRAQAAYAIRSVVSAGADGGCALATSRRGLIDSEPFVRSQCALTLGLLKDVESIPALSDLFYDPIPLVGEAAAEALVGIAKSEGSEKGRIARTLVLAYDKGDARQRRRAKHAMVRISDVNYGDDATLWAEWAGKLP